MKYFSMFSGIGGFELGIEKASDNKCSSECKEPQQEECGQRGKWDTTKRGTLLCPGQQSPLCVGYSEINKYAIQIYQRHWPGHKNYGDATKINPSELPDFDMLCGGFPCQSFSIAGKRKGFEDTRGTLFHEILRIASEKKPGTIFLENVKGLLSADQGRCFGVILCSLDELGYDVEWQVLNSKNFGVPQNRERVFIVGHLRGEPFREVFPLRKNDKKYYRIGGETDEKRERFHGPTLKGRQRNYGAGELFIIPSEVDTMINLHQWRTGEYGDGVKKGESFTLDQGSGRDYVVPVNRRLRRLTPVECERLQGFPDNWTNGISDSQRYKCIGNAVTVNVIEAIVEEMI